VVARARPGSGSGRRRQLAAGDGAGRATGGRRRRQPDGHGAAPGARRPRPGPAGRRRDRQLRAGRPVVRLLARPHRLRAARDRHGGVSGGGDSPRRGPVPPTSSSWRGGTSTSTDEPLLSTSVRQTTHARLSTPPVIFTRVDVSVDAYIPGVRGVLSCWGLRSKFSADLHGSNSTVHAPDVTVEHSYEVIPAKTQPSASYIIS